MAACSETENCEEEYEDGEKDSESYLCGRIGLENGSTETPSDGRACMGTADRRYLVLLMDKYKETIENRKNDVESVAKKNATWVRITREFNEAAICMKTAKQLKKSWDNIKTRAKKERANEIRKKSVLRPCRTLTSPKTPRESLSQNIPPDPDSFDGMDGIFPDGTIQEDTCSRRRPQQSDTPTTSQKFPLDIRTEESQLKIRLLQRQAELLDLEESLKKKMYRAEETRKAELHHATLKAMEAKAEYWMSIQGLPPSH